MSIHDDIKQLEADASKTTEQKLQAIVARVKAEMPTFYKVSVGLVIGFAIGAMIWA